MKCTHCHRVNGPTIRGLCKDCDPVTHTMRQRQGDAIHAATERFTAKYGVDALSAWRLFEMFIDEEALTARRASHLVQCTTCQKTYGDHPLAYEHLSNDGQPYLHRLCNGDLVKL